MYTNNLWLYYHFSKITKLQITNYIKVVGVCLSAAKNKSLLLYINKNIYIINYYLVHYKTIIFYLFGTIRKV